MKLVLKSLSVIGLFSALLTGCGGMSPENLPEPVSVAGSLQTAGNKPVGDVVLNIQPLESGYSKAVDVSKDGKFSLETYPGKYAYYFTAKSGAKTVPAELQSLREPDLQRTVTVSNAPLTITLP